MKNPLDKLLDRLPGHARSVADWVIGIAIAVAIVLAFRAWVVTPYAIPTASMEPTLHCSRSSNVKLLAPNSSVQPGQTHSSTSTTGSNASTYQCQGSRLLGHSFADRVLVNRFIFDFRSPHRGEIVVFKPPRVASLMCSDLKTSVLVKRLIGLPGDNLVEKKGVIYVNGKKLKEPYIKPDRRDSRTWPLSGGQYRVPKREYFFMGDNRKASCDSREWGTVPRKNLIGPVFMTYWPPDRISFS